MPRPACFDRARVGASFRSYHISFKAAFEGAPAQAGQDLIANVATGQIYVMWLQQQCPFKFSFVIPHAPNRPSDKAEGAACCLELRDIGQPFSKEPDESGMKGVTNTNLFSEIRPEGLAVDWYAGVALCLVVGHVGSGNLCRMRGIHRIEEAAGEHRSSFI